MCVWHQKFSHRVSLTREEELNVRGKCLGQVGDECRNVNHDVVLLALRCERKSVSAGPRTDRKLERSSFVARRHAPEASSGMLGFV
jgi:hypothetical protein